MRRNKFAPRLLPIDEDLTASMLVKRGGTADQGKATNVLPRSSRGTAQPRSSRGSALPRSSRGKAPPLKARAVEVERTPTATTPATPVESAIEKVGDSVEKASAPVTLEPLRNRADTAPAATATATPAVVVRASSASVDNKYNRSVLHGAVRKGDIVAVKRIVAEQPELLRRADIRGNQPLHYAANGTGPHAAEIVYVLLKAGAGVNAVNERQQTPLLIHVIASKNDDDAIVRILLHHKAKPLIKMTETLTLSHYAASRDFHKIAAALNEYM